MGKLAVVLVAAVTFVAAVAGCGGEDSTGSTGGEDGTGSTAALTKAEFLEQGNTICAQGTAQFEKEFQQFTSDNTLSPNGELTPPQLVQAAEDVFLPAVQGQLNELRALPVPEGEEAEVARFLGSLERALQEAEAKPSSVLAANGGPFAQSNNLAREYGLVKCSE